LRVEDLDFDLPSEAIAQRPAEPRDSCRLMHLVSSGAVEHTVFSSLPGLLKRGDTLVFNDSKVLPARVIAQKPSGGTVELLFLRPAAAQTGPEECWQALVRPSRRLRTGSQVLVAGSDRVELIEEMGEGRWMVRASKGRSLIAVMEAHGRLPVPPYITSYPEEPSAYQTVYASSPGSAAAPTAGLHFTRPLLKRLQSHGINTAWVTLHVGLDTFLPIRESVVEQHRIHSESYDIPSAALREIVATRERGGRVVAVGTTVARVLETVGQAGVLNSGRPQVTLRGSTGIFITPGYRFLAVDALLTNFHLPRSTVLTLAMAFAGVERLRAAYRLAIAGGYRFFSFGDAMLIEKLDTSMMGETAGLG
jgi:S-adenosylmethionine:tRNA ribosyltransferase-isomerase